MPLGACYRKGGSYRSPLPTRYQIPISLRLTRSVPTPLAPCSAAQTLPPRTMSLATARIVRAEVREEIGVEAQDVSAGPVS